MLQHIRNKIGTRLETNRRRQVKISSLFKLTIKVWALSLLLKKAPFTIKPYACRGTIVDQGRSRSARPNNETSEFLNLVNGQYND